jgi:putative FmdB family regulatory protein
MPTYSYTCDACGQSFEKEQRISEDPLKKCELCGKLKARRQIVSGNFILKGGGWYSDGYGSASKSASSSTSSETKSSDSSSSGKAEASKAESGKAEGGKAEGGKAEGGSKAEGGKSESTGTTKSVAAE